MDPMEIDPEKGISPDKRETKPIMIMLIGLPGSGKSTFCDEVMKISPRLWARVCQDTANNGKAGTKAQCLTIAASSLMDGKNVFIDRCNIDREQRADFVKLADTNTEKHAVVLDLAPKLCISRSVKRTEHEGNLQGGRAAAVVNQMASKKDLPKLSEGFDRITFCQDEKDVEQAIRVYGTLGVLDSLPSGCYGQKNSSSKTQQGIMKFFKKVNRSVNQASGSTACQKSVPGEISTEKNSGVQANVNPHPSNDPLDKLERCDKSDTKSASGSVTENILTLAFPSISTADFQFDLDKASDIIVEKVEEYISKIGNARLVLVDLSHRSKILSLVKTKAAQRNIDSTKFFTFVGDITRLRSQGNLHCNVIANVTNWRLKPGGGGVNSAIFEAAGSALVTATKEKAASISSGKAVVVPLPSSSPLFVREGVTHVIHVLGPNMNPMRPDCLKGDYVKGCKILREAYSSLFEEFFSVLRSHGEISKHNKEGVLKSGDIQGVTHSNDEHKSKRESTYKSDKNKKYKGSQGDQVVDASNSMDQKEIHIQKARNTGSAKTWASWAKALHNIAMHPHKHKNVVLELLDDVLVMNDAYPKAQRHLLILARIDGLDSIADVSKEHLSLLKTMHSVGLKWAEEFLKKDVSLFFRLGYHSVPSMQQLHLHVISQDFNSSHLKNKKHWNSFNTPFFLDSVDVIKELEETGNVTLKYDKILEMELRCHRCRSVHPNIPRLKSHISSCQAPFPTHLLQNGHLVSSEGNCMLTPP